MSPETRNYPKKCTVEDIVSSHVKAWAGAAAHRVSKQCSLDRKLDVKAAYPEGECFYNISRRTTVRELVSIDGIDENVFRAQNMGLSAGHVNSLEYCTTMFNAPKPTDMLEMFRQDIMDGLVTNLAPQVIHIA